MVTWENNKHRVSMRPLKDRKSWRNYAFVMIRLKSEEGNLTIIAFVLLVVLTLIAFSPPRQRKSIWQTAYNEVPYKQNFYIAEAGEQGGGRIGERHVSCEQCEQPQVLAPRRAALCRAVQHVVGSTA